MKSPMTYPKVRIEQENIFYIEFFLNGKRRRFKTGHLIGSHLSVNEYPIEQREAKANQLAFEFYDYLVKNDYTLPEEHLGYFDKSQSAREKLTSEQWLKEYDRTFDELTKPLKIRYVKSLKLANSKIRPIFAKSNKLSSDDLDAYLNSITQNATHNNIRRHAHVIIRYFQKYNKKLDVQLSTVKDRKVEEGVHQPIPLEKLEELFGILYDNDKVLFIVCGLMYSSFLRPHREIRELTWGELSADCSLITLSGSRNKSKNVRHTPVDPTVQKCLQDMERKGNNVNVFSGKVQPYNPDYFKTRWSRFKKKHELFKEYSFYSFRHTGADSAMDNANGNIRVVQKMMNHSKYSVTEGYLKKVKATDVNRQFMPKVKLGKKKG